MTQEKMTPLRERMIEDMRIHGMGDKAQKATYQGGQGFCWLSRSARPIPRRQMIFAHINCI